MPGHYELIGDRWSYFPAFQNERLNMPFKDKKGMRLDGPPFWSCTFTALMYGINFAFLGKAPAEVSQREIIGLALDSGDDDLKGGGTTSLMQKALRVRYDQSVKQEALKPKDIATRLAAGDMLVAGIRSADLNDHFRRFIGNSGALHRAAFVGLRISGGKAFTRILDPMAVPSKKKFPNPRRYSGEWFPMTEYVKAAFSDQQLWFAPGGFLPTAPRSVVESFSKERIVRFKKGATIVGIDKRHPERKVLQKTFPNGNFVRADKIIQIKINGKSTEFLHVVDRSFEDLLLRRNDPGLTLDPLGGATRALNLGTDAGVTQLPDLLELDLSAAELDSRKAPTADVRSGAVSNDLDDDPLDEGLPEGILDTDEADPETEPSVVDPPVLTLV